MTPTPRRKTTRAPERGQRIAAARRSAGLTQPELAAKVGASRPTIARIEGGTTTPTVRLALAIARELDDTVEALFGGES